MALSKPPVGALLNPIHPLSRGVVGYWQLGEGGGLRVNDSSYGNNPGVLTSFTGNPWVGSHHGGQALKFDGTASYVKISAAPVTTYPLTMGAWVKLSTTTLGVSAEMVAGAIVNTASLDEFWFGYFNNGGVVKFRSVVQSNAGANTRQREANVTLDLSWHFLVAVFIDASTHAIYYDGVLQSSAAYVTTGGGNPAPAGLNTVSIGGFFYNTSTFYSPLPGTIEGFFIQNRILAASEVAQLYDDSYARFAFDDLDFGPAGGGGAAVTRSYGVVMG